MRIVMIADSFWPSRSSGAVQLQDMAREFVLQGHSVCVLVPSPDQRAAWLLDNFRGVDVLRLKAPRTKDVGYLRRTIAELSMPFIMLTNLCKSPLRNEPWEGIVWYSPSIFFGPLVSWLRRSRGCKSYLILRDIFPEWAVDVGILRKGLVYELLSGVARYQYSVADVIGVQTSGNLSYFQKWSQQAGRKLEVLQNWLSEPPQVKCSVRVDQTSLKGRKVFVYAGNMGVAQGFDVFFDVADKLRDRADIGFLLVGRGSEVARYREIVQQHKLDAVVLLDEIDSDEIPDLYNQCHAGIVALDPRHKSHNIPGKFLTYMRSGLPVLATINAGNDLGRIIQEGSVGEVCEGNQPDGILLAIDKLLFQIDSDPQLPARCTALFERQFSVDTAAVQVVAAVSAID